MRDDHRPGPRGAGDLATLADRVLGDARRLRPIELVREYRKTILDELDLMREAGNAAQLKRNFAGSSLLYVPEVHWDYCRVNVMVMERIHGVIVSRLDELRARGANIPKLAENGVEIFSRRCSAHNFFHADMHPGNIFVQTDDPQNPRYAAVDFGIVGTCSRAISTIWPRISWPSSTATMRASPRCTSNRAGCRAARGWTSSSRPCAPSANPYSTSR
jgi:predicted unusual protein kinase regulating ubiquinone biosynthesis (AarF/ABC1/UbiB family)